MSWFRFEGCQARVRTFQGASVVACVASASVLKRTAVGYISDVFDSCGDLVRQTLQFRTNAQSHAEYEQWYARERTVEGTSVVACGASASVSKRTAVKWSCNIARQRFPCKGDRREGGERVFELSTQQAMMRKLRQSCMCIDLLELVRDERVEDNVTVCAGIIVAAMLQSAACARRRIVSRAREIGEKAGSGLVEVSTQHAMMWKLSKQASTFAFPADLLELVRDEKVEDNVAVCAGIIVAAMLQFEWCQARLGEEAGSGLVEVGTQHAMMWMLRWATSVTCLIPAATWFAKRCNSEQTLCLTPSGSVKDRTGDVKPFAWAGRRHKLSAKCGGNAYLLELVRDEKVEDNVAVLRWYHFCGNATVCCLCTKENVGYISDVFDSCETSGKTQFERWAKALTHSSVRHVSE
ncbi:hypothetical protein Efla_007858 [Eimeria flavescens]